jgi:sortase A
MASSHFLESAAWGLGLALLLTHGAARVWAENSRQDAIRSFQSSRQSAVGLKRVPSKSPPDQSLWSTRRIDAFDSVQSSQDAVIAVLRIPELGLEVPVFEGTTGINLNRGAARIEGTSAPGTAGNVGIAAHRDGFFRKLKDAQQGQALYLETRTKTFRYRIADILIVEPDQVSVLVPTERPTVTLVTCYPFYYVGSAPLRFIVRAESGHQ